MQISESIIMAFHSLWAHKLRSFLALLGVIIGVFTIVGMQSVISGFRQNMHKELSILGSDTFQVQKYPAINIGGQARNKYRNRKDLTWAHGMAIQEYAEHVAAVGIEDWSFGQTIRYQDKETRSPIWVAGGIPEFALSNGYFVQSGRFLTESDVLHNRNVAVIGMDIVEELFPFEQPLGATIKIQGRPFRLIGVIEERGTRFGESRDNRVIIPLSTWQQIYSSRGSVNITVRAASAEEYQQAIDEVTAILRTVRKVPAGEPNDFEIFSSASLREQFDQMTRMVRFAVIGIASISLLVAGIGIMNIMMVTVTERTKEIGVRKALGARQLDIMLQFLVESIILSISGAVFGTALGIAIAQGISSATSLPAAIPSWAIIVALLFCTLIGLFFGLYPAAKAAGLDPISSLRYE